MTKQVNYIIPHTHWDREWRYPIWTTRKLLIEFMTELLDILDNDPEYHYFLMDGQVAPIKDYLEMCPEERDRLTKHLRSGRIGIGPWYTLPDLYPLDGECLLRNLNAGISMCREFGGHLRVGYNSFGWGQTAQLPQIYADYGFDTIICAKKVSDERAPYAEFIWEAPDGTRVLTSRLGRFARANFFFHAYINVRYGLKFLSDEFSYRPRKAGFAVHNALSPYADDDYFLTIAQDAHDFSYLKQGLMETFEANSNTLCQEKQLLLSGCDFSTPQPDLSEIIKKAGDLFPDMTFKNAPLHEYTKGLHEGLKDCEIPVVLGELRDGPACDCSGNALASRMYLKLLNKKAQNLLLGYAEPLCTAAVSAGGEYPKAFLEKAWVYMLDSHSHDAINGVTQDKTADDVEYRLNQALELGQVACDAAVQSLLSRIDLMDDDPDAAYLCVFNPLPYVNRDVISVVLDTSKALHAWSVSVTAQSGETMDIQERSRSEISCPVHDLNGRPWPFYADRHEVYLDTGEIPALGYRVFKVAAQERYTPHHHYWYPMRKTAGKDICKAQNVLENAFIRVTVQCNGTFDLLDKESGRTMRGLNYFEDAGDVGNYWAYYPPYKNKVFNTLTASPQIWLEENGSLCAVIAVAYQLELPCGGDEPLYGYQGRSERSEQTDTLKIVSRITLKRDARRVEIKTTVDNTIRDHRLRVGFPTGIKTDDASASGHFTVDERPVAPTRDENDLYWKEMQTLPMQSFVDISDGTNALALLSNSFCEYEALSDADGTVMLTLFRAVKNMIVTGWECVNRYPRQEGSQLQRSMEFEYAVYPHTGDWALGEVFAQARSLLGTPLAYQTMGAHEGMLPREYGFLNIENKNLILSAYKMADDGHGCVLRVYNPTASSITSRIRFAGTLRKAHMATMAEQPLEALLLPQKDEITIGVDHHKIVTLRLEFEHETL